MWPRSFLSDPFRHLQVAYSTWQDLDAVGPVMVLYCLENNDRRAYACSVDTQSFHIKYYSASVDQIHGHIER